MPEPYTPEDDSRFKIIVGKILENEGSALNDNHQTGEVSKFGITLKFLQAFRRDASRQDIVDMTREAAAHLYRIHFWTDPYIWRLNDDALAYKAMDLGVNMGPATAIKLLQRALNGAVKIDGVLGPQTAAAANTSDPETLMARFKDNAERRYREIVAENPVQAQFLDGWLARLEKV